MVKYHSIFRILGCGEIVKVSNLKVKNLSLKEAVMRDLRTQGIDISPEESPVGEHQSNGSDAIFPPQP